MKNVQTQQNSPWKYKNMKYICSETYAISETIV